MGNLLANPLAGFPVLGQAMIYGSLAFNFFVFVGVFCSTIAAIVHHNVAIAGSALSAFESHTHNIAIGELASSSAIVVTMVITAAIAWWLATRYTRQAGEKFADQLITRATSNTVQTRWFWVFLVVMAFGFIYMAKNIALVIACVYLVIEPVAVWPSYEYKYALALMILNATQIVIYLVTLLSAIISTLVIYLSPVEVEMETEDE